MGTKPLWNCILQNLSFENFYCFWLVSHCQSHDCNFIPFCFVLKSVFLRREHNQINLNSLSVFLTCPLTDYPREALTTIRLKINLLMATKSSNFNGSSKNVSTHCAAAAALLLLADKATQPTTIKIAWLIQLLEKLRCVYQMTFETFLYIWHHLWFNCLRGRCKKICIICWRYWREKTENWSHCALVKCRLLENDCPGLSIV